MDRPCRYPSVESRRPRGLLLRTTPRRGHIARRRRNPTPFSPSGGRRLAACQRRERPRLTSRVILAPTCRRRPAFGRWTATRPLSRLDETLRTRPRAQCPFRIAARAERTVLPVRRGTTHSVGCP